MKTTSMKKLVSLFLCVVLAAALVLTGCGKPAEPTTTPTESTAAPTAEPAAMPTDAPAGDLMLVGEGATAFTFVVSDLEGKETHYEIHTDKETVGEALMENDLVKGTVGEWGLMVDTVNGLTLDFAKDGMYWAFYINGEYAQTGIDTTPITAGAVYSFVPTEG